MTYSRPIGPESREPFMGTTMSALGVAPIGWLYLDATGWATRAEITDPTWLDLRDLPRKRRRAAVVASHPLADPRPPLRVLA